MKRVIKSLIISIVSGGVISSCQLEPYEIPAEEAYTREFIKQFGVIDKNQDWNIAARKAVTVNPGSAEQVKVYAYVGNTRYIFANYQGVQGTQTLEFDLPEGIEDIIVRVNGVEKTAKVGETVDFSEVKARGVASSTLHSSISDEWTVIDNKVVHSYASVVAEEQNNIDKVTCNFMFISRGPFTFYPVYWNTSSSHMLGIYWTDDNGYHEEDIYKSKQLGDLQVNKDYQPEHIEEKSCNDEYAWAVDDVCSKGHTITRVDGTNRYYVVEEVYVQCNHGFSNHQWKVGDECADGHVISRIDESGNRYYQNSDGSESQCWGSFKPKAGDKCDGGYEVTKYENWQAYHTETNVEMPCWDGSVWKVGSHCTKGHEITRVNGWNKYYEELIPAQEGKWEDSPSLVSKDFCESSDSKVKAIRTKGITVDLPEHTHFGFYIKVYDPGYKHTVYSEEKKNLKENGGLGGYNEQRPVYGSTFTTTADGVTRTFFGFEDWNLSGPDLNDLIFMFADKASPSDPPVTWDEDEDPDPDPVDKPFAWLVACEDLGNTGDIDFNDIVFKVEYTSGESTATFIPLATGATLESDVYYTNASKELTLIGEIHTLLGGSAPSFINTTSSRGDAGDSKTLDVATSFSMAYTGEVDGEGKPQMQNVGGFVIKTRGRDASTDGWTAELVIKGAELGDAPQMICLPYEYVYDSKQYEWAWPKERVSILKAYPNFKDWVDNTANNDWYNNFVEDYVVSGSKVTSVTKTN